MCNNLDEHLKENGVIFWEDYKNSNMTAETRICPICGKDNGCTHNENCWCFKTTIPKEIFELIPEDKKGKACICKSCVDKYKELLNNR